MRVKINMPSHFSFLQCDLNVRGSCARILIWSIMGMALAGPASATKLSPADAELLLQIDLQNELILGTVLSPNASACLNDEAAGGWVLPANRKLEISDRAQQRAQRSHERCISILSDMNDLDVQRNTSEALHKGFAAQLQARLALEETKKHARSCLTAREGVPEFKRCMQAAPSLVPTESAWSRWLDLFARYKAGR